MEKYKILETIGDGTYGTVFKGINTKNNEYVAIKKMKKKYTDWDECLLLKEVQALINLKHANIVTLNELILEKDELNMIFEFIGVNLFEWAKTISEISECKIRNISFQILQGLAYMHKNNFFHRDMKPENILISGDQVKLADFGLAKEIRSNHPFTDYVATRWYRSPEVILNSKTYSSPIDIFALGAIIVELYNAKPLFPGKQASDQMNKICEVLGTPSQADWSEGYVLAGKIGYKFPQYKGHRLRMLIPNASENALNLLEGMLSFNPTKRPNANKCLQHPFFQCYDVLTFFGLKVKENSSMMGSGSNVSLKDNKENKDKKKIGNSNTNGNGNAVILGTNMNKQNSCNLGGSATNKEVNNNNNNNNAGNVNGNGQKNQIARFEEFLNSNN